MPFDSFQALQGYLTTSHHAHAFSNSWEGCQCHGVSSPTQTNKQTKKQRPLSREIFLRFFVADLHQKTKCLNTQELFRVLSIGVVTALSHALLRVLSKKVVSVLGHC